ncbi:glycine betaine/L-proline ABC transporter ATP-binding protein [Mesorhizobium hawassense]|uniref:Quaternary amine transport ATP-binding protein n=2 Tax=Mesorhizobium hawassense TaxID=1209954 RepID=A0A330HY26_9HYPH|nr:glycine betaine/L-proline ABC transporter ATP-binding protein [Mesorhizobium hawassense]
MSLLKAGVGKEQVLTETRAVVGLNDVSLTVPGGAMYMIMGLSGSGKSTLARCINRLNEPTAGKILLDGRDIVPLKPAELLEIRRRRISMVFQHFALLPNKTVVENAEFGLKMRGVPLQQRRKRAEEILSIVGLGKWCKHYPHELSGGMRQRVGLARALATDADLLIMDEAFSALDPLIRSEMQDELLRLQRTLNKTIVFITHDFQEAVKLGTRIAIMKDGAVVREGTPQAIVADPGNDYVSAFTREVDRSRVFEASAVMQPCEAIGKSGEIQIVRQATGKIKRIGFALDSSGRVVGLLDEVAFSKLDAGSACEGLMSREFVKVRENTKLIDAVRMNGPQQPMAVVDADDRFVGLLQAEHILAFIASSPSTVASAHGVPNV